VGGERRVVGVDDEVADELAQAAPGQRHHQSGCQPSDPGTDPEQQPVDPRQEAHRGPRRDPGQLAGGDARVVGAGDAVDEAHGEVEALGVADQGGELPARRPLGACLVALGGRQPAGGEGDRVVDQGVDIGGHGGRGGLRRTGRHAEERRSCGTNR
jgi:hypothetical protein